MKKILLTLFIMSFTIIGANCANVVIEAANQQINVDKNKGFFSGDVKVSVGDIVVKSPRAELDLEPKSKKPSLAVFFIIFILIILMLFKIKIIKNTKLKQI